MPNEYGWENARIDLEIGINPDKVAERLGEPVDFVREVADERGWAIRWSGQTAQQSLDAGERWL